MSLSVRPSVCRVPIAAAIGCTAGIPAAQGESESVFYYKYVTGA